MKGSAQHGVALLIGIDKYRHRPTSEYLRGAVSDAEAMASVLENRYGFDDRSIILLRNAEATRQGILDAFTKLSAETRPGTRIVVHWSGHGSQRLIPVSKESSVAPHGFQETLVPYDGGARGGVDDLSDQEILGVLARLERRGAVLTWIVDACHSGHLYRDRRLALSRHLAPKQPELGSESTADRLPALPSPRPVKGPGLRAAAHGPRILLAACRHDQEAFELPLISGVAHGEWSYAMTAALQDCRQDASARQVFDTARLRLIAARVPQTPQMVGASDRRILGVRPRPPVRYFEIRSADDTECDIGGGCVHGLHAGSRWRVVPPGIYDPKDHERSTIVEITRVEAVSSVAQPRACDLEDQRPIEPGDWAYELSPAYGELRLGIHVASPAHTTRVDELKQQIDSSPVLFATSERGGDKMTVRIETEHCQIVDPRGRPLVAATFDLGSDATSSIIERLERHARARHGLRLQNRARDTKVRGKVRAQLLRRTDGVWRPAEPSSVHRTMVQDERSRLPRYSNGEQLALELEHNHESQLYLYVLDFGLSDVVTQIFPPPGGIERFPPKTVVRPGTAEGDELDLFSPTDAGGIGFLKVVATTAPVHLDWLRTDVRWPQSAHRSTGSSLEAILSMGSSGGALRDPNEDWGCVLCPFWLDAEHS